MVLGVPKPLHEALHRVFHRETDLFVRVLHTMLDIDFPEPKSVELVDSDLTDASVLERHVDTVFLIETTAGKHVIAIESQTSRPEDKRATWPFYVAALHNKYHADVSLLVVTPNHDTAFRARKPIKIGLPDHPTMIVQPLVLGPDNVPRLLTTEQAMNDLTLAVFSAITHRESTDIARILTALAQSLSTADPSIASDLAELTAVGLTESAAQDLWRKLMSSQTFKTRTFIDDWRDEARAEGRAEGEANALLAVLAARGIEVPDDARARITSCTDVDQLSTWIGNAVSANSIEEVFA